MSVTLRDRIRQAKPSIETLEVKGWDSVVGLKSMTLKEKTEIIGDGETAPKLTDLLPNVIIATVIDPETKEPLFTSEDLDWLSEQPSGVIEAVAAEGLRVSGLSEDAVEVGKGDS